MVRYLAISFSALVVFTFAFSGAVMAANPQIVNVAPLTTPGKAFKIGEPLGLAVVFSKSVYGFNIEDIISNGRVLSVEGQNRNYRIVVVPQQRLLTLDILADSARGSNRKGNDPIVNGPFIFDTKTSRILSGGRYSAFGVATAAALPAYGFAQQTTVAPALVQSAAPVAVAEVAGTEVANDPAAPKEIYQGTRFIMNVGTYSGGPSFINIESQTAANPTSGQEVTLGFETVKLFPNRKQLSGGFYLLTGYHRTLYAGGSGAVASTASYTAIPLEIGGGLHVRNYMSFSGGLITHIGGTYTHDGYINIGSIQESREFTTNLGNRVGFAMNVKFKYRKVGLNLRYVRFDLGNFNQDTRDLGLGGTSPSAITYSSSNFINSVGFFLSFNS
ncbi:MAG: hypothetical protein K0U41_05825 [Gammaproteobacteria bacterium]|nr:hypothetical protein [Gammaproteobacteria bacterium]